MLKCRKTKWNHQLTLRWGYYNHALRQVANWFNKVMRLCLSKYTLILSFVNGLWIFRKGRSGVMFIISRHSVCIRPKMINLNIWIVSHLFKLLPKRHIFFDLVIRLIYHKQEVCFLLYFLGQIVSWQYNPNLLDWNCTVKNDIDWQLLNCPIVYNWVHVQRFTFPLTMLYLMLIVTAKSTACYKHWCWI